MRKSIIFLIAMVLSLMLVSGVSAQGMFGEAPPWIDDVPQMDPTPWEVGQFAAYNIDIEVGDGLINADVRFAVIGEEEIDGENFFWFELDIYNIGDLPEDLGMMGGEFEIFKLQLLMKEYDMKAAQEDPEALMKDLFGMEIIKGVIFQLNDETPMEIDMSFLQMMAPMIEMSMEMGMDNEMIHQQTAMWDDADWGYEYEDISTAAGSFNEALHLWFNVNDDTMAMNMNIYSHQDVPLMMMVKLNGVVHTPTSGEEVNMDFEIIDYGNDAEGWIEGEPELFSFDMMGDMMGGMMGGM